MHRGNAQRQVSGAQLTLLGMVFKTGAEKAVERMNLAT